LALSSNSIRPPPPSSPRQWPIAAAPASTTVALAAKRGIKEESEIREATDKEDEPNHRHEHANGAYLRQRMRFLEGEVNRLQETVERLVKECANRTGTDGSNDDEWQAVGSTITRGTKGNAPGASTEVIMGPPPHFPRSLGQRRVVTALLKGQEVTK
jgi:hypothetical protein